jgi:hypothetical protein
VTGAGSSRPGPWIVFVGYLGLTFYLSSRSVVPGASLVPDYVLHALEFSALTFLLLRALSGGFLTRHRPWALVTALVFGPAWGLLDEFHQSFVPGRDASLKDAAVDTAATGAAVLFAHLAGGYVSSRRGAAAPDGTENAG